MLISVMAVFYKLAAFFLDLCCCYPVFAPSDALSFPSLLCSPPLAATCSLCATFVLACSRPRSAAGSPRAAAMSDRSAHISHTHPCVACSSVHPSHAVAINAQPPSIGCCHAHRSGGEKSLRPQRMIASSHHLRLLLAACFVLLALFGIPAAWCESRPTAQQSADELLRRLTANSGASDSSNGQAIGMAMVMRVIQQQNKTGRLPPLAQINAWMREVHGDQAIVFRNVTEEEVATPAAAANASSFANSSNPMPREDHEQAASISRMSRQTATTTEREDPLGLVPRRGPVAAPTASVPAPPLSESLLTDSDPAGLRQPGAPGSPNGDVMLETALRRIRYGMYQAIFGWSNFAGAQLGAVADFLLAGAATARSVGFAAAAFELDVAAFIIAGVGYEVTSIGFGAIGSDTLCFPCCSKRLVLNAYSACLECCCDAVFKEWSRSRRRRSSSTCCCSGGSGQRRQPTDGREHSMARKMQRQQQEASRQTSVLLHR